MSRRGTGIVAAAIVAALLLPGSAAHGQGVATALAERRAAHDAAREVQRTIDTLSGRAADGPASVEDRALDAQIDNVRAQIAAAGAERDALRDEIARQREIQAGILPLLHEMVDILARAVDADLPFDVVARRARVGEARAALARHDLRMADRFDAVVRAYRQELALGYESTREPATLDLDGRARNVTLVRVGRVGFYYVSDDASRCGAWSGEHGRFTPLAATQCDLLSAAHDAAARTRLLTRLPPAVPGP